MVEHDDARPSAPARRVDYLPDSEPERPGMRPPAWMRTLPPPPAVPRTDPAPTVHRRRWAPACATALGFGLMGAVMYASLHILVGQEVQAAAVIVGVLVGAGMRIGGRRPGWATGLVSGCLATCALFAGVAVGQACLDAIALPASLGPTMAAAFADPAGTVERYLDPLAPALIAAMLAVAGALLATLTFGSRRGVA